MNEENFEYLSNNIKYLGFGEDLNAALKEELQNHGTEFQLSFITIFGRDEVEAILHFRKSNINEMYFFDKYFLHVRKHDAPGELIQPFYIYKGKGITCKEGYNLLCGRAVNKDMVNKEGESYNAWLQLDLSGKANDSYRVKQYHENYGFDLEKTLIRFPIEELADPEDKERLIKSMKKGNLQPVTFEKEGKEIKMWVAANPRFRTIDVFDINRKIVRESYQTPLPGESATEQGSNNGLEKSQIPGEKGIRGMDSKSKVIKGIEEPMPVQRRPKRKRISI